MRKMSGLNVRLYAARMIDINEYLSVLPGAKASDKICGMELNEVLFNSMPDPDVRHAVFRGLFVNPLPKKICKHV